MKEFFDYLIALAIGSFGDVRDDFETVNLKTVTPKLELTSEGFEMTFEANGGEWKICLSKEHGLLFIEVYVPYTSRTIPCRYSKQVHFFHEAEAKVMYDKIVNELLAA